MAETLFPPAPNWASPQNLSTREDGSIIYGSQNDIVILRRTDHKLTPLIIKDLHSERITSVAFSPVTNNHEKLKNLVLSSSDDGFVKLCSIDTLLPVKGHNSHKNERESSVAKVVSASWSRCNSQYIVSAAENDTLVLWDAIANTTKLFCFAKLKPTILECSYHNELIVAVGSKTGKVVIIKLANKGEIIYKLRGHDKEVQALSWCPTFGKFAGSTRFEHHLLASSSQEKEIFIWNTKLGIDEVKIQLPKNPFSKTKSEHHGKWDLQNFVPIIWSDTYVLYSGTRFGELISCDLKNFLTSDTETQKMSEKEFNQKVSASWSLNHIHHSKAIIAISVCPNIVDHKNHEKDCTNDGDLSLDVNAKVNHYFSPSNLIWTLGRDWKLTAVHEHSDQTNPVFYLSTINGHGFEAVVSPHDPNQVAIANGDGRVRIWNALKSSGKCSVFWKKISDRIYSLAWHPMKERILAYGTSEGRVGLIEVCSQKQAMCFKAVHHGKVYRVAWGPPYAEDENRTLSDEHGFWLYSIGGYKLIWHDPAVMRSESVKVKMNSGVSCTKFSDLSWKPDYSLLALAGKDGNIYLLKPPRLELIYTIDPSKKSIQSLVWHPTATTLNSDCSGLHGYFTFGSTDTDSVIKVYNYFIQDDIPKVEQVTSLEGHSGYVQSVSWSPHISGRLISTGADYTARIWDVTTDRQLAKFVIGHTLLPLFSIWSPLDPDVIISGYALRTVLTWRISTTNNIDPIIFDQNVGRVKNFEKSDLLNNLILSDGESEKGSTPAQKDEMCGLPLATNASLQQLVKENKMFKSAWKSNVDPLTNCYKLLTGRGVEKINFLLPFLDAENIFYEFLNKQAISYETSNNWNACYELAMWRGNLKEILEEKVKTGHLDDFLVSLAPFVSPRLWHEACVSYSKTLFANKLYRKAACYLLAIHKIHDAIELLLNSKLFLEALCIARCRLPESDPIFNEIVKNYAEWLTVAGSLLRASECLLYLGEYSQAARLLLNKKDKPEYLSLAALAFKKAGCEEKELQYSFSALLLALTALNQDLASRICYDHGTLKPLSLVHKTHNLIYQLDSGKLECREDLINHLKELTDASGDQSSYKFLSYIYDRNILHTDKNKLYVAVARELSLASCIHDKDIILTHIIRALNSASKYMVKSKDEVNFLFKLCTWLSPNGYFSENSIFMWSGVNIRPKITSLRAFLCQGIAEHLDFILSEKDKHVDQNLVDCLKGLVGDVLNKDAFNYFKNQVEIKSGEMRINNAFKTKNEGISENDEDGMNENVIASAMNKIDKLESDLKIFENSRIIAPNPAFVYCILRRVSEMLPVADVELSATIEQKWNELQTT